MQRYLLSMLLLMLCSSVFCTKRIITASGFTFTPESITITFGDSVDFQLTSIHSAIEVSFSTWNINGNTPLPGFATPLGGGLVLPAQLPVGTHYFVCQNHYPLGMKGTIIVQSPTGIAENPLKSGFTIFPNPSMGKFVLDITNMPMEKNTALEICNINGITIYRTTLTLPKNELDLSNQPKGIYFLKIFYGETILTKRIIIK